MTYQAELFISVMLGLGVGHFLFNVSAAVGESTDACCVDDVAEGNAAVDPSAKAGLRTTATHWRVDTVSAPLVEVSIAADEEMQDGVQREVTLLASPIECDHCVDSVTKALLGVHGVASATVGRDGFCRVFVAPRPG